MKKQSILVVTLLACFIVGCSSANKSDTTATTKVDSPKVIKQESTSLKDKLIGIWTDGESPNATFKINQDSIYYVDHFKSYKYILKSDSIKIFYDDYDYTAKIYFVKDTLVMNSPEYDIAKFWKFTD